jgi:hypothetical protein
VNREERQQLRLNALNGEGLEIEPDAMPLDFLLAVFRSNEQPMNRRVRCAEIAAKYCHPALTAMAVHQSGQDFGVQLERAIAASDAVRQPMKMIEAKATSNGSHLGPTPDEVSEKAMGKSFAPLRRRA